MRSHIPLVDLQAQHRQVAGEIVLGFAHVFETTSFIGGPEVQRFEEAFASLIGTRHCIAVGNGTDALELTLRAVGIGAGDEVLLPANTFIATALAVARAGATPVLVDCDPRYHLTDLVSVEEKMTQRTRALLAVHLYGQLAPMEQLAELTESRGIVLLEDAAQAQGATRNGRGMGSYGVAAGTSFYPGKNLGAYGDAGAIVTDSGDLATKLRALRNYGSDIKYLHPETGFNSRLDTLQAVVLLAKLPHLPGWNEARRLAAARYDELLSEIPDVRVPETLPGNEHIYHLYVVRVPRRDETLRKLQEAGIGAAIHYPVPIHLQGAFRHLGHQPGDFPVAEAASTEILSLPMFPEITPEQQERVVGELQRALGLKPASCIAV